MLESTSSLLRAARIRRPVAIRLGRITMRLFSVTLLLHSRDLDAIWARVDRALRRSMLTKFALAQRARLGHRARSAQSTYSEGRASARPTYLVEMQIMGLAEANPSEWAKLGHRARSARSTYAALCALRNFAPILRKLR